MEASEIKTKALLLSLATVACIEVITRIVISKNRYDPMVILGAARFLETSFIILIVMTRQFSHQSWPGMYAGTGIDHK